MNDFELWQAAPQDIARGTVLKENKWVCLLCGEKFENGVMYEINGTYYEAFRAVTEHIQARHGSVFLQLMLTQQKYTSLTEHQANLLKMMFEGRSDKEIAQQTAATSNTAAIRNLRFQLKEREKQAKAYLALMEAFRLERENKPDERVIAHEGNTMEDGRFDVTEKERAAVLKTYFTTEGALKEFPVREKRKIIVLQELSKRFETGRAYSEKEVNALIAYPDFATIRRYLIEYGFLQRTADCSEYRVKE